MKCHSQHFKYSHAVSFVACSSKSSGGVYRGPAFRSNGWKALRRLSHEAPQYCRKSVWIKSAAANVPDAGDLKEENARLLDAINIHEKEELSRLRAENTRLREVVEERWGSIPDSSKDLLRTQHAALREQARQLGVDLPSIGELLSPQNEATLPAEENGAHTGSEPSEAEVSHPENGGAANAEEAEASAEEEQEVEVVQEADGTVSFKFKKLVDVMNTIGGRQGDVPQACGHNNRSRRAALLTKPSGAALSGPRYERASDRRRVQASAEPSDLRRGIRTTSGQPPSAKPQNGKPKNGADEQPEALSAAKKRKEAEIVAEEAGGGAEDSATPVDGSQQYKANGKVMSVSEIVEEEVGAGAEVDLGITPGPVTAEPIETASSLVELAVSALLEGDSASYETAVSKVLGGKSQAAVQDLQKAVSRAVDEHDPALLTYGKPDWRYFVFPHAPVAGSSVTIYVNKATNDIIRQSPRVQVHAVFNEWELGGPSGDWFDLKPVEGACRDGGAEWWSATIPTPDDAFDLNYVFGDGDGNFDNNGGLDYKTWMLSTMTVERWEELQPDRQAAEEARRAEVERVQREEAAAAAEKAALEQDRARGEARAVSVISDFDNMQHGAVVSADSFRTVPEVLRPGTSGKLLYNAAKTSLGFMSPLPVAPTLRIGYNGWRDPQDIELEKADSKDEGDWWAAAIEVPEDAAVINFVIQYYDHYDNNGGLDYKVAVGLPGGIETHQEWQRVLSEKFREEEYVKRKVAEAEWARKCEKRAKQRAETKAKAKEVARRQMKHVLFTEPPTPVAGEELTLFYNPNNTCLHNRNQIFVKGGWNRWSHKQKFGPLEMVPPGPGEEHYRATVSVPKNAYRIDFVFSDVEDGPGTYDNRGGLDYGLPVDGCVIREPSLYVVHVAVEMAPICKVGGLGDVVTALGRAVQEEGNMVEVILPRYNFFLQSPLLGATVYEAEFDFRGDALGSVYGRNDDAMRFDWFCAAALEFLLQTGRQPDILHCHDWSTAPVAGLYWRDYHFYGLGRPRIVFTIHNAEYGLAKIGDAAHHSQRFTTVSPKYREDICGLPAIANESHKFVGIRNGIDCDIWGPRERPPLVGVVSRLTAQKGIHLIKHTAYRTLERGGQFILLGSAPDPKVQGEFNALNNELRSENAAFCFTYDEPLSHLIYAGCDLIVVPSMFEPCGLTQMIAMRYGSIPVVRHTGGLYDTVFDVDNDKGRAAWHMEGSADYIHDAVEETNGFAFEGTDPMALDYALNRALDTYYNDRDWFHSLAQRVMRQDWSWARPALDYIELYYQAMKSD
eukprot:jgi/Botrbrau1/16474/Bobra.0142s0068.1